MLFIYLYPGDLYSESDLWKVTCILDPPVKLCYSSRKNEQDFFICRGDLRVVSTRYIFSRLNPNFDLKSWSLIPQLLKVLSSNLRENCLMPVFNLGWTELRILDKNWRKDKIVSLFFYFFHIYWLEIKFGSRLFFRVTVILILYHNRFHFSALIVIYLVLLKTKSLDNAI